jgi:hypothetical protein
VTSSVETVQQHWHDYIWFKNGNNIWCLNWYLELQKSSLEKPLPNPWMYHIEGRDNCFQIAIFRNLYCDLHIARWYSQWACRTIFLWPCCRALRQRERDYQGKKMVICIMNSQPTRIAATRFFHYNAAHVEPICFPFPGHYEKLDLAGCILVYSGEIKSWMQCLG